MKLKSQIVDDEVVKDILFFFSLHLQGLKDKHAICYEDPLSNCAGDFIPCTTHETEALINDFIDKF